jgi:hypothetical protein
MLLHEAYDAPAAELAPSELGGYLESALCWFRCRQ